MTWQLVSSEETFAKFMSNKGYVYNIRGTLANCYTLDLDCPLKAQVPSLVSSGGGVIGGVPVRTGDCVTLTFSLPA
jgi:hypothetical protein